MEELVALPGVGRRPRGWSYAPGSACPPFQDTHVTTLAERLGLTERRP